jgi:hypothetical protein
VYLGVRHRRDWLPWAVALAGFAVPFGGYLVWQHSVVGRWTPYATTASGWFLYSRVAEFGHCDGVAVPHTASSLCAYTPTDKGQEPEYFLFAGGPARRMFPNEYPGGGGADPVGVNRILRDFAVAVIKARPLDYASATLSDFAKFFEPATTAFGDDAETFHLMDEGRSVGRAGGLTSPYFYNGSVYRIPGHPFWPGSILRAYQRFFHTARWLLAMCVVAVLVALTLRRRRRWAERLPARPEQIVLVGGPILALLGQSGTAQFALRYELPFVGLLVAGGAIASSDLMRFVGLDTVRSTLRRVVSARKRSRSASPGPAPGSPARTC